MKNININLEIFEGPFELLFRLIEKNKINIYDIPISQITEQYISYVKNIKYKNMDEMSQFILMSSTLLHIKSKFLLPNVDKNEEDPRKELVDKLLEYKKIKDISEILRKRQTENKVIFKNIDREIMSTLKIKEPTVEDRLSGVNLTLLYNIFCDILKKQELKKDKIRSNFGSIKKAVFNIKDKIQYIKDLLYLKDCVNITDILEKSSCKSEAIVTFLAILELAKENGTTISQSKAFDTIILTKARSL